MINALDLIDKLIDKVTSLVNLLYEGTADQPGSVVTSAKTYLKAIATTIDLIDPSQITETDDMIKITEFIERLYNVLHTIETKQFKKNIATEEWIHKRIYYLKRDTRWIINKLDGLVRKH